MTSRGADASWGWVAKATRVEWGEIRAIAWAHAGGSPSFSHARSMRSSSSRISTSSLSLRTGTRQKQGCSMGAELEDMSTQCREGNGGMKFDIVMVLLLSSFAPNILRQVWMRVHGFGVPMCCQLQGSLSISGGIVIAVSFPDNGDLIWPRPRIVLLLL